MGHKASNKRKRVSRDQSDEHKHDNNNENDNENETTINERAKHGKKEEKDNGDKNKRSGTKKNRNKELSGSDSKKRDISQVQQGDDVHNEDDHKEVQIALPEFIWEAQILIYCNYHSLLKLEAVSKAFHHIVAKIKYVIGVAYIRLLVYRCCLVACVC